MKTHNFLVFLTLVYAIGVGLLWFDRQDGQNLDQTHYQLPHNSIDFDSTIEYLTTYTPMYTSLSGEYEPLDINCPIPMSDRVINGTGIQCVWSSIEMLGRWAEEPKLINPPITSRSDCKSFSSPSLAAKRLTELKVNYHQEYGSKSRGLDLIRRAMAEGRGCLFGVPGHAMVIVHFDESADIVKFVDNSDRTLKVQSMTVSRFLSKWDSWVLVIYADRDIIPQKIARIKNPVFKLGVEDRNNPQGQYPQDYIPLPLR